MSKKPRKHRVYSEDFKREAIAMYENSTRTCAEICRLMDISAVSVLNRWRVLYGSQNSKRGQMKQQNSSAKEARCKRDIRPSKSDNAAKIVPPLPGRDRPSSKISTLQIAPKNRWTHCLIVTRVSSKKWRQY